MEDLGQSSMSVRWVITEKITGSKHIINARGFEEDREYLRKDSPTCSKEAVRLALAFTSTKKWMHHSLDVKAAYLQGSRIERVLFLRPPSEFDN